MTLILRGLIQTQNDVNVSFDVLGFFLKTEGSIWKLKANVIFHADATQYSWLNSPLMFWEGHFDMGTYHHHYKVYSSFNDSQSRLKNKAKSPTKTFSLFEPP